MLKHILLPFAASVLLLVLAPQVSADQNRVTSIQKKTKIEELSHKARYRYQTVKGFTRRGDRAQRYEIRHGDCGRSSGWNDCKTDRVRVERKERPKNAFSKPGRGIWYGYSIYIPADTPALGDVATTLSQAKVEGDLHPIWALSFKRNPYVLYADGSTCNVGSWSQWRGRWNDITVYANYATRGQSVYFEFYKDGRRLCSRTSPIMPRSVWGKSNHKIGFKYGVYHSFVSRYLAANATKPVAAGGYTQNQSHGGTSKSPANEPFKIDWGGELPTWVILYDEMLAGFTREAVDVRMREQAGLPPVD